MLLSLDFFELACCRIPSDRIISLCAVVILELEIRTKSTPHSKECQFFNLKRSAKRMKQK